MALLFFRLSGRWGEWLRSPLGLSLRERAPISIVQEGMWALGSVWSGAEVLAFIWIRSSDCPTRNESL